MNKYGEFINEGKEYRIFNLNIPRKWENYIWNHSFLCRVAQDGTGNSFYRHPDGLRSELVKGIRNIYVLDTENGNYWSLFDKKSSTECIHGIGYTRFLNSSNGVDTSLRITVPPKLKGEAWQAEVRNGTDKDLKLRVFTVAELDLTGYPTKFGYKWSIHACFDKEKNLITYVNQDADRKAPYFHGFLSSDKKFTGFETVGEIFFGFEQNVSHPETLKNGECKSVLNRGGDQILGVLQFDISLAAGDTEKIQIIQGLYEEPEEVEEALGLYLGNGVLDKELDRYTAEMDKFMSPVKVDTPDPELNRLFNIWTKNNLKFTGQWTRMYSRGFRDVLQDTAGVVSLDKEMARKNILEAMENIYRSGRCRRAWANLATALSDEFYSDGPVWIPLAVNGYIRETGDTCILYEECSYYDGGKGTVLEHMVAAVRFLYNDKGEHGLSLIHDGDWCDSAHMLGKKGRGEGVWLTIALYNAVKEVERLARFIKQDELAEEMAVMAEEIREKVNMHGWDGEWFLVAYNDDGRKVGSKENKEGQLFLNPQSWAVLSGVTTKEREKMCLSAIDKYLDSWVGPLLLTPPYTEKDTSIGSLTGFAPGTIENGSCYCHAASFKIVADCVAGRGNHAMDTLKKIIPGGETDRKNPIADCPPYAYTNSRVAPFHPYMAGRHLFTWTTGTVSWCWQAMTQWILGIRPEFEGLMIDPCIPWDWEQFSVVRTFRGSVYNIEVYNPEHVNKGVKEIYLDGMLMTPRILPVTEGKVHEVKVIMGK